MAPHDPDRLLTDEDTLSLTIGRVVRAHARVEYGLRNVREALDPNPSLENSPAGFLGADRLVNDCVARLRHSGVTPTVIDAGVRALEAARDASGLRNQIVHNLWMLESDGSEGEEPLWNLVGPDPRQAGNGVCSRTTTQTVENAQTALEHAAARVSGLFMALHEVLPRFSESPRSRRQVSGLPRYLALMDGHLRLDINGDWEFSSPV
ncbi:hypothetical protein [Aeromicrobium sp. 9AM]|uniref:hypothetical protein n=1 Tax=Aeromicrobium sp. 9AM TaxID=2653126 RepID=UPI0012F42D42|nr:hypothetical protein [Aeromicrobium sp. 9AM]VXB05675.1 conserved hypothetical protein [Aeromicrobium sp. 9AM]